MYFCIAQISLGKYIKRHVTQCWERTVCTVQCMWKKKGKGIVCVEVRAVPYCELPASHGARCAVLIETVYVAPMPVCHSVLVGSKSVFHCACVPPIKPASKKRLTEPWHGNLRIQPQTPKATYHIFVSFGCSHCSCLQDTHLQYSYIWEIPASKYVHTHSEWSHAVR